MNKTVRILSLVLVLGIVLVTACAPQAAPAPQAPAPGQAAAPAPAPAAAVASAPAKAAWQAEWEKTLAAAQKEGKVVIANAGGSEMRNVVSKGLNNAYGLGMESITGKSAEIAAKLFAERRAGLYLEDMFLGSTSTTGNVLKPEGILTPLDNVLILPDVNDPKVWYNGEFPWFDKDHQGFAFSIFPGRAIAINTTLVRPEDVKSWRDVLNPKWKGKLMMNDPTTGGAGQLAMLAMDLIMGWDYVKELAKAEPMMSRDERQQMDWLAHGKVSILIAPKPDLFTEFLKLGAPVAIADLQEGTWLSCGAGAISMFKQGPHPNASKVFINWLLSKDGQTMFANAVLQQSARTDVSTASLPPDLVRQPGKKYFPVYDEAGLQRRLVTDKLSKDLFGPMSK